METTQSSPSTTHSESSQTDKRQTTTPTYDIVLYGASSFVGNLTADYLNKTLDKVISKEPKKGTTASLDTDISWAIAGRNLDKLNEVKEQIGNSNVAIIIADSEDAQSLQEMAAQAKVIISTVGPYIKYGEPLIKACVENGTDYVDLCGEALFIKDMMDKYQDIAHRTGARIVNSCGFDSIPSDLGVLFTQNHAMEMFGAPCTSINMRVKTLKGGLSGGTIASMAAIFEEVGTNKERRKQLANPYILNNDDNAPKVSQDSIQLPKWDEAKERWMAPFVMASINERIVHRSNQLKGYAYSREFKYDEAMWMPSGLKGRVLSYGMTAAIVGFAMGMMFQPSRDLLNDRVLPKSGSGPSKQERENGSFDIRFIGFTKANEKVCTKVTGDKDPGYGSTCKMLAQSALCLVQDVPKQTVEGGFWTPASAMGEPLIERLIATAGLVFELQSNN